MTNDRPFGTTGFSFFPLGLGTIWFGRQWPPGDAAYRVASSKEIHDHLLMAYETMGNQDGVVMIDTAASYGEGELRIGEFLRQNRKFTSKSFLATKWGEDFDSATGMSSVDHSVAHLRLSLKRSLRRLGTVDLFYIHKTTTAVLRDDEVIGEMIRMRERADVRFLGASISDGPVLEAAMRDDLLRPFEVIQMPAALFLERPDLVDTISNDGKAVVINSPIRQSDGKDPRACYSALFKRPHASVVLTGTRTHLADVVRYANAE